MVLANTRLDEHPELLALVHTAKAGWTQGYTDLYGRPVIGTTALVPNTEWVVVTELPQAEAYAASRAARWVLLGGTLVIGLLLSLTVSILLKHRFLQPMQRLQLGVQQIGKGDLTRMFHKPVKATLLPLTLAECGQVTDPGDCIFDALLGLCRNCKVWKSQFWSEPVMRGKRGPTRLESQAVTATAVESRLKSQEVFQTGART